MAFVAPILFFVLFCLCLLSYLKNLYNARRHIKITTLRTVRKCDSSDNVPEVCVRSYPQPPGPTPWPIIGNLITLGKYDVPFIGLTELAKTYGNCFSLTLGQTRCLVVNNLELIREVLNQNGKFFGGRPDFLRFHTLFGGDRSNCKFSIIYFTFLLRLFIEFVCGSAIIIFCKSIFCFWFV